MSGPRRCEGREARSGEASWSEPFQSTPGHHRSEGWQEVLAALSPIEVQLDAALAAGDVESAVRLAFGGAQEAVSLLTDTCAAPGAARWHKVYVELTPLSLDAFEDGTLAENGAYVNLEYQGWAVPDGSQG